MRFPEPNATNDFLLPHVLRLLESYRHWTGRDLLDATLSPVAQARALFEAPFALVSHNTDPDPIFNYANRTALDLFEMTWDEFTALPSRLSAEPIHRDERARLMAEVTAKGYIAHYSGIRISKTGKRFRIENAFVWNLLEEDGALYGQAALFTL
jgi:hypothetical protein